MISFWFSGGGWLLPHITVNVGEEERPTHLAPVSLLLSFVAQAASLSHVCTLRGGGSERGLTGL